MADPCRVVAWSSCCRLNRLSQGRCTRPIIHPSPDHVNNHPPVLHQLDTATVPSTHFNHLFHSATASTCRHRAHHPALLARSKSRSGAPGVSIDRGVGVGRRCDVAAPFLPDPPMTTISTVAIDALHPLTLLIYRSHTLHRFPHRHHPVSLSSQSPDCIVRLLTPAASTRLLRIRPSSIHATPDSELRLSIQQHGVQSSEHGTALLAGESSTHGSPCPTD